MTNWLYNTECKGYQLQQLSWCRVSAPSGAVYNGVMTHLWNGVMKRIRLVYSPYDSKVYSASGKIENWTQVPDN